MEDEILATNLSKDQVITIELENTPDEDCVESANKCKGYDRTSEKEGSVSYDEQEHESKEELRHKNDKASSGHYVCLMDECKTLQETFSLDSGNMAENGDDISIQSHEHGKKFVSRSKFWKHVTEYHSNPENLIYSCEFCTTKFALQGMKDEHEILKHIKPFACIYCGMRFGAKNSKSKHERLHAGDASHECTFCGYHFSSRNTLLKHISLKHDTAGENNIHTCNVCMKTYATELARNSHVKLVHEKQKQIKFNCKICNKGFSTMQCIKLHVKSVHLKIKDSACLVDGCDYRTNYKSNLDKHSLKKHGMIFPIEQVKLRNASCQSSQELISSERGKDLQEPSRVGNYSPTGNEYLDLDVNFDAGQLPVEFECMDYFEVIESDQSLVSNPTTTVLPTTTKKCANKLELISDICPSTIIHIGSKNAENPNSDYSLLSRNDENEVEYTENDTQLLVNNPIEIPSEFDLDKIMQGIVFEKSEPVNFNIGKNTMCSNSDAITLDLESAEEADKNIANDFSQEHDQIDEDEIVKILLDLQSNDGSDIHLLDPTTSKDKDKISKEETHEELRCPLSNCHVKFSEITTLRVHLESVHSLV